jgi:CRP-like cAMP-binding protein
MELNDLKKIQLFQNLPASALQTIHDKLDQKSLKKEEILFHMGDLGDELIIVKSGQIAIFTPDDSGNHHIIRIFTAGESLGEMALIDEKPRSLSAKALTDSEILALNKAAFLELLSGENYEIPLEIMRELSARVRYTTDFLNEVKDWVQIIAEGHYESALQRAQEKSSNEDQMMATLAADFAQMASKVQRREQELKQQVAKLKIEIDENKRKEDFEQIVQSDYYQSLLAKRDEIRKKKNNE